MRSVKINESMDETIVATRINLGIQAFLEEADPEAIAELYNQYAVSGSGQIRVIEYDIDGTADYIVVKDGRECRHEPDLTSITTSELDDIYDVSCKHCGQNGSFRHVDMISW